MKKLLAHISLITALLGVLPATALADLQCFAPPYTTGVNVQNANQCATDTSGSRLYDTSTKTWLDPNTGGQVYDPTYSCVGLAPAYRTNAPTASGDCLPGYKLGQITNDQNGNLIRVDYKDGTVETATRNASGGVVNTTYGPATPPGPAMGNKLTYIPLEPLPGGNAASYGTLSAYLNLVFKILISIGAMVAVVTLVLGGITYMVSEVVDKKSDAKRRIQAALIGLFLLLTCWLILNQINPNLTQFNLVFTNQPNNYNPGNPQNADNNGQNRLSLPTAAETTACEAPGGVPSGKTIHTYEAGSWVCL